MCSITSFLILLLLTLVGGDPAWSDVYSWIDKNGTLHFADTPPADNVQKNPLSPVEKIIAAQQYSVTLFKIVEADDPGIVGTYVPTHSTSSDLPEYEMHQEPKRAIQVKAPQLFVTKNEGKWQWIIKTDYSRYLSNIVNEGTPPDKVASWIKKDLDVFLSITRQDIETSRKLFSHMYRYNLDRNSPDLPDWQKQAYRVTDHPEQDLNGEYYPVTWSSETPRYRTDWGTCLILHTIGSSWQWNLGKCEMLSYSSSREPARTMPHKVRYWIQRAGIQITPFTIEQITR